MSAWRFRWVTEWDAVWRGEVAERWQRLASGSTVANAFHEPALVRAWAETVGAATGAMPVVGLADAPDGTEVLLPWVITPQRGSRVTRRVLEPMGHALFGYHDPLAAAPLAEAEWSAFWASVRPSVPVAYDSALFRLVHAEIAVASAAPTVMENSPVLEFSGGDFDFVLRRLSKNAREQVRRSARRIAEAGGRFESLTGAAAAAEVAGPLATAHRTLWRARPAGSVLDQPRVLDAFTRFAREGTVAGWARLDRLVMDGAAIAWHFGLVHRTGWHWWLPAYDAASAMPSPGAAMLAHVVEQAVGAGAARLHLMIGNQRYKQRWHPAPLALRAVRWYAPAVRGAALRLYDSLRATRRSGDIPTPDDDDV